MMFQEIRIWKKEDEGLAIRYFCLLDLSTKKYRVQSADFFRLPLSYEQLKLFEVQAAELFIKMSSSGIDDWYATIEDAIESHEASFS